MKRIFALIISLMLLFCGCGNNTDMENPCNFYYLQSEVNNTGSDSVIAAQVTESAGYSTQELITRYLAGATDNKLVSPFPSGVTLISLEQDNLYVRLTVSDELASLSGIDLSLACVCLSKTCFGLTGADLIEIRCQTQRLNGNESITIGTDSFSLQDAYLLDMLNTNTP